MVMHSLNSFRLKARDFQVRVNTLLQAPDFLF